MLTGSSETAKQASKPSSDPPSQSSKNYIPPIKTGQKKQGFKLYERRNSLKIISHLIQSSGFLIGNPEILSPSILGLSSPVLSPVTPLIEDPFSKSCSPSIGSSSSEEKKAIAEKGFYLHPSPRTMTPTGSEPPQLLPLFPVTSPRVSELSSS
ncbi:VQ motif-containing protein 4 [Camellia lanceoleosa]|uniref:VQ motif-containing protein 4 n=1 Tax=Camellia lanceoleosa TaxID=1840588 RepID=A0ACC0H136_9ERIC|nr:VQ motif-containing protein 4 [Camellia lanceoleosa]